MVSPKCSSDVLLQSKSDTVTTVHFVRGAKKVLIAPRPGELIVQSTAKRCFLHTLLAWQCGKLLERAEVKKIEIAKPKWTGESVCVLAQRRILVTTSFSSMLSQLSLYAGP